MYIVCGVSGTGKSTVGSMLAERLGIPFFDADDFHPRSNVDKMQRGVPLNDDDRKPWLETLAGEIAGWEKQGGAVLACSALKESYRQILASRTSSLMKWIILHASEELITRRLNSRKGHFFDPKLLVHQLKDLEMPDYGWVIDIEGTPEEIVDGILARLRGEGVV